MFNKKNSGFSLAEILIALGIIALISIFAIPKFRTTADTNANKNKVKTGVMAVQSAYQQYKAQKNLTTGTLIIDMVEPYLNYVKIRTDTLTDHNSCAPDQNCSTGAISCFQMNDGSIISISNTQQYTGITDHHSAGFIIDADGGAGGEEGVQFHLYADGKVRDIANVLPDTLGSFGTTGPNIFCTPGWWNWD